MFDTSNPKQRERLLVALAAVIIAGVIVVVLPSQFSKISALKQDKERLKEQETELIDLEKSKDGIQKRLDAMLTRSLVPAGRASENGYSPDNYLDWLSDLISDSGLQNYASPGASRSSISSSGTSRSSAGDFYTKWAFPVSAEGSLDQIADFLRRFHSADYLHKIFDFAPKPVGNRQGIYSVTFRIEALALSATRRADPPQVAETTDRDREMLASIRERAILSPYTPPRPQQQENNRSTEVFYNTPYCFVDAVMKADDELPQCWITIRTTGERHHLYEGESFTLRTTMTSRVICTIKKIEWITQKVQIAADGGVYTISVGQSFQNAEEPSYFVSFVDAEGQPWTPDSQGEPLCEVKYDPTGDPVEERRYLLAEEGTFPMKYVVGTVKKIDAEANQIQIEAVGVLYTFRNGGSFSEFSDE